MKLGRNLFLTLLQLAVAERNLARMADGGRIAWSETIGAANMNCERCCSIGAG